MTEPQQPKSGAVMPRRMGLHRFSAAGFLGALVLVLGFCVFQAQAEEHPQLSPASAQELQQAAASASAPDEILDFTETVQEAAEKPGWVETLPRMGRFMIGITIILVVPSISRRCHLPPVVGLILTGIACGPHVLGMMRHTAPVLARLAKTGRLLRLFTWDSKLIWRCSTRPNGAPPFL